MCNQPSQKSDYSVTDRDRHEVRVRYTAGILIAVAALAAIAGYIIISPDKAASTLLAAAIVAAVGLLMWIRRCGEETENQRQSDRLTALEERDTEILTAIEARHIEQRRELIGALGGVEAALLNLGVKMDRNERERVVGRARALGDEARASLHQIDEQDGRTYFSAATATPPGGIALYDLDHERDRRRRGRLNGGDE